MDRLKMILTSPSLPVVLSTFLWACGNIGIIKTVGIYLEDIALSLGTTSKDFGIALGLFGGFTFFPAPLIAALYRSPSIRRPLFVFGACLSAMGLALVAIATSNAQIALFLSLSGFGNCILLICNGMALHCLAGENFNLLYSLGMSGFATGMVLLPFLAEILLGAYGWRGGLLIIAGLMAHIIPTVMAVNSKLESQNGVQSVPNSDPGGTEVEEERGCRGGIKQDDGCELDHEGNNSTIRDDNGQSGVCQRIIYSLRQSDFYVDPMINVTLSVCFAFYLVYSGWHFFLVPHALQRGISVRNTIIMTFTASIGNISGRITVGVLTNNLISPVRLFFFTTLVNITAIFCDAFVGNYYVILVTSCLSGMSVGARATLAILIVRDRASPSKFDAAFAVANCVAGLGILVGGYLSGMIADRFSSYDATFKLIGVLDVLVLLLITILGCKPKQTST